MLWGQVFVVATTESTALVYAIRAGGSDTDLAVSFSTQVPTLSTTLSAVEYKL